HCGGGLLVGRCRLDQEDEAEQCRRYNRESRKMCSHGRLPVWPARLSASRNIGCARENKGSCSIASAVGNSAKAGSGDRELNPSSVSRSAGCGKERPCWAKRGAVRRYARKAIAARRMGR